MLQHFFRLYGETSHEQRWHLHRTDTLRSAGGVSHQDHFVGANGMAQQMKAFGG